MRVFAKDVSGQKLDRGFESRPLRWLVIVESNRPFDRLLVDVADPAAECEEIHPAEDGDRAEGVTAQAIGNTGKRREAVTGGHGNDGHATEGCCDAHQKLRSHDTSRIAWAKLMARVGEGFPVECPTRGGDTRLRKDGRQEPAHFEPEVRKREKARMASPS